MGKPPGNLFPLAMLTSMLADALTNEPGRVVAVTATIVAGPELLQFTASAGQPTVHRALIPAGRVAEFLSLAEDLIDVTPPDSPEEEPGA